MYYVWAQNRGISVASDGVSAKKAARYMADGSLVINLARISAKRISGVLSSAAVVTNAVQAVDEVAPEPVVKLQAKDTPDDLGGSITVMWSKSPSDRMLPGLVANNAGYVTVPGVLSYEIYRRLAGEDYVLLGSVGAGVTSYVDASVNNNRTYTYDVRAADASNEVVSPRLGRALAARNVGVPRGDWTSDGRTGVRDFLLFAAAYGKTTEEVDPMFDLNNDGLVNFLDFFEFATHFGSEMVLAKPVPVAFGQNAEAVLSLSLLEDAAEDLAVRVSLDKAVELMGYSFIVRYDPGALRFDRAAPGEANILTSKGGTTAPFLVLSDKPGELTIANVLADGDAVAGQGATAEIFFTSKDELGGGQVRLSEGVVVDANHGTNAVILRSASVTARPKVFALRQNYPNPFNPATTIEYALPEAASVRLDVYNTLGQVVATLVSEKQDAGRYSVRWDGLNSSGEVMGSGVYFYSIVAGDFHAIKRMLLIK
jgi:hypothetical protein